MIRSNCGCRYVVAKKERPISRVGRMALIFIFFVWARTQYQYIAQRPDSSHLETARVLSAVLSHCRLTTPEKMYGFT